MAWKWSLTDAANSASDFSKGITGKFETLQALTTPRIYRAEANLVSVKLLSLAPDDLAVPNPKMASASFSWYPDRR